MNLVIIESHGKTGKLKSILGPGYEVIATLGHCVDLPRSKLSVDVKKGFTPTYAVVDGKKEILDDILDKAKKASTVYLCTDPDREGESISWHVANYLKGKIVAPMLRVRFNEITKAKVTEAMANPSDVDADLVEAQTARRILDRLCGYKTSFLTKQATGGESAGRVQSVALRLIVERDKEIRAFTPEEYWDLTANLLSPKGNPFVAEHTGTPPKTRSAAELIYAIASKGVPMVTAYAKDERFVSARAPFDTQAMMGAAKSILGWSASKTAAVAQDLYQAGLCTYIRTDSAFMAPEAVEEIRGFVKSSCGPQYIPSAPNVYKSKKSAQQGHEAIRPTHCDVTSISGTADESRLYELIWNRAVSSQMTACREAKAVADIDIGKIPFRAQGSSVVFEGWRRYWPYGTESVELPPLAVGDVCTFNTHE